MKHNAVLPGTLAVFWILIQPLRAAPPPLAIEELQNGQIRLSWPGDAAGFILEQADSLNVPAQWRLANTTAANIGGRFSVTIQAENQTRFYRLRGGASATTILETSPALGESGVAVTRETIFRLSGPLAADAMITAENFFAEFGGRHLLSRVELSSDRRTVTLFYLENLPASAQVRVSLAGNGVRDAGGIELDADGNGQPGGTRVLSFTTSGTTALENTAVIGHVFASELGTAGANRPLEGAIVTVDGAEESLRAVTDATGAFQLQPSPAGRFFVHVDGRTAVGSQWPNGAYYPLWTIKVLRTIRLDRDHDGKIETGWQRLGQTIRRHGRNSDLSASRAILAEKSVRRHAHFHSGQRGIGCQDRWNKSDLRFFSRADGFERVGLNEWQENFAGSARQIVRLARDRFPRLSHSPSALSQST